MTIYFRGGEDFEYNITSNTAWSTTAGQFRAGYARCAVVPGNTGNGQAKNILPWNSGAGAATYWFSSVMTCNNITWQNGVITTWFYDTANVLRFYIVALGANSFQVFKRTAAGVATSLGTFGTTIAVNTLYKWDFQVVGGVSGVFNIFITQIGGTTVQVFGFSGDTTTDGAAQPIAYHAYGNGNSGQLSWAWSEGIAASTDTRSMGLVTLAPVANGNTHNFDTGTPAAANVNEVFLNDATLDGSSVAGQIDQYTIGALPSGQWQILDFAISARMLSGSGPAHMDLGVRSGATPADFWSPDISLSAIFAIYQYDWPTDPSSGGNWPALPVNIGLRSVT
jgi:hypothetical protein